MRRSGSQAPQLEGSDTHSAAIRAARREFGAMGAAALAAWYVCLLYTSPSPRDS